MSVERYGVQIAFTCDSCSESFTPDEENSTIFEEAWGEAKAAGWRAVRVGGTFEHLCPVCAEED